MSFTMEIWKQKASQKMGGIGALLERWQNHLPYLLYGSLCGMSLWPLVEAVRTGEILPVMMSLGGVTGGVGGNLLAEQLQRWRERADEAEVVEWVVERAPTDPDLRQGLDQILCTLDAVTQAQAKLSEVDRHRFATILRQELIQLGNLSRFEAALTGSSAIAHGSGAVAAGAGGVAVGGDVHGDVVTGVKSSLFDQREQRVGTQINIASDLDYVSPPKDE